jgi:hypothetical protein
MMWRAAFTKAGVSRHITGVSGLFEPTITASKIIHSNKETTTFSLDVPHLK